MTLAAQLPTAVMLAAERVRADAANTMRHDTTSDLTARLMCRVGVQDLGLVLAWVDQHRRGEIDPREDDPTREGIFRSHNCWRWSPTQREW